MENRGLIFIPDISGFTRFVNAIEIDHSKNIIAELLDTLINANTLGLEISEIEGDAILFYKYGSMPDTGTLYLQVARMFGDFHRYLAAYDIQRYCHCKACTTAINLSLKVISHYGEFTGYQVKTFNKLIGKDIIVAHQLLKNDIDQHEYWLVTRSLMPSDLPEPFTDWMQWEQSAKQTESGEIKFHYTQLTPLKNALEPIPPLNRELTEKTKMFSLTREFDTHLIALFHASGDYRYRHKWMEGVRNVEEVSHFLPRLGMRFKYATNDGEYVIYSSSYVFDSKHIEFSETDEAKTTSLHYILDKISDDKTRLTIDYYVKRGPANQLLFSLTRRRAIQQSLNRSLDKLEVLVQQLEVPRFKDTSDAI